MCVFLRQTRTRCGRSRCNREACEGTRTGDAKVIQSKLQSVSRGVAWRCFAHFAVAFAHRIGRGKAGGRLRRENRTHLAARAWECPTMPQVYVDMQNEPTVEKSRVTRGPAETSPRQRCAIRPICVTTGQRSLKHSSGIKNEPNQTHRKTRRAIQNRRSPQFSRCAGYETNPLSRSFVDFDPGCGNNSASRPTTEPRTTD